VVLTFVLLALALAGSFLVRNHPLYEVKATVLLQPALVESGPGSVPQTAEDDELAIANGDALKSQALAGVRGPVDLKALSTANSQLLVLQSSAHTAALALAGAEAYVRAYLRLKEVTSGAQYDTAIAALRTAVTVADDRAAQAQPGVDRVPLIQQRNAYAVTLRDVLVRKELASSGRPQVISPPGMPDGPVKRPFLAYGAVAAVAGLIIGMLAAAALDHADDRIRDAGSLAAAAGAGAGLAPVLPVWPRRALPGSKGERQSRFRPSRRSPSPTLMPAATPAGDCYVRLRLAVERRTGDAASCQFLQVTSAVGDDGAAETAVNLAAAFARTGRTTVLVDLDARDPDRLSGVFSPDGRDLLDQHNPQLGATDAIRGRIDLRNVLVPVSGETGLGVVLPGQSAGSADALSAPETAEIFEQLRAGANVVVILTPPVVLYPEHSAASAYADHAVLVARAGETRAADVRQAVDLLRLAGDEVSAVVLTAGPSVRGSRNDRLVARNAQRSEGRHGRHARPVEA
jgi:Mrp family chromosome partitioning ATPase